MKALALLVLLLSFATTAVLPASDEFVGDVLLLLVLMMSWQLIVLQLCYAIAAYIFALCCGFLIIRHHFPSEKKDHALNMVVTLGGFQLPACFCSPFFSAPPHAIKRFAGSLATILVAAPFVPL